MKEERVIYVIKYINVIGRMVEERIVYSGGYEWGKEEFYFGVGLGKVLLRKGCLSWVLKDE